jgi:lysophospholipase L1-like esterase
MVVALTAVLVGVRAAEEPKAGKVRLVLVGDSTVTDQGGWGGAFAALLKPGAECINLAKSGHSSKSYYDQGYWQRALAQKPDFVLVQFGHNDQPGKGPGRETDSKTTYADNLRRYVDQARQAGARPILVTSLVRRVFGADGKLRPDLESYVEAMKAVAAEKQVALVDLHRRSKELVERLGSAKAQTMGPPHPKFAGKFDGTHLSPEGAKLIAPLVVRELADAEPALRAYLVVRRERGAGEGAPVDAVNGMVKRSETYRPDFAVYVRSSR